MASGAGESHVPGGTGGSDGSGAPGATRQVWFEDLRSRLVPLPEPLPEPPGALLPVRADTGELRDRPLFGSSPSRAAAVLVLLFPDEVGEARVVLTERVDRGGHHAGEVSFPGGSAESDEDPVDTALREAAEEVGLDAHAEGVEVLGVLPAFWIPVSGFVVTPVVAMAPRRPSLRPAPDEVATILEPPLGRFVPGAPIESVEREVRGWRLRFGAYPVDGLLVWGATARVLGQLGALLAPPG